MATTNDLKNGMTLNLDGNLMNVVEFQHVKPGKGGAFVRTKLKNVRTGRTLDKTFRADEPVEVAILEKREMQYLYRDETGFHFMDTQTYDQSVVDADAVDRPVAEVLARHRDDPEAGAPDPYTVELVDGVVRLLPELDARIADAA